MTQLLVSVRSVPEAAAALAGGADIIDIKEPARGSLGPADMDVICAIVDYVAGRRPVSVAAGELRGEAFAPLAPGHRGEGLGVRGSESVEIECVSSGFGPSPPTPRPGVPGRGENTPDIISWHKFGLAGCRGLSDWPLPLAEISRHLPPHGLVVAAYADAERAAAPSVWDVLEAMPQWNGTVLLVDTWQKDGRGLLAWFSAAELHRLRNETQRCNVRLALAGSLTLREIPLLKEIAPDIVAVRGAVCEQGQRNSEVKTALVAEWKRQLSLGQCFIVGGTL